MTGTSDQQPQGREQSADPLPTVHPSALPFTPELLLLELLELVREDPGALDRLVVVAESAEGRISFRWSSMRLADVCLLSQALGDGVLAALRGELPGFEHVPASKAEVDQDEEACGQGNQGTVLPLHPEG